MDEREEPLPPENIDVVDDPDREQPPREPETELDEDDRLKPEFVRDVIELAEAGEGEAARERVGRLHPADIADLFELARTDERPMLAAVLGDMLSADVLAEMNDYVREELDRKSTRLNSSH